MSNDPINCTEPSDYPTGLFTNNTLRALGEALEVKEPGSRDHGRRVGVVAGTLARIMKLADEQVQVIARAAFLHEIGKLAIPDAILRKPAALNPEEMLVMREYCYRGYEIGRQIPFLADTAEIVYSHRERFDGTGYPRGLKGEAIPLGARIVAIADTFALFISDRPHNWAGAIVRGRDEIRRWSGTCFDPGVIEAFLSIPDVTWKRLQGESQA